MPEKEDGSPSAPTELEKKLRQTEGYLKFVEDSLQLQQEGPVEIRKGLVQKRLDEIRKNPEERLTLVDQIENVFEQLINKDQILRQASRESRLSEFDRRRRAQIIEERNKQMIRLYYSLQTNEPPMSIKNIIGHVGGIASGGIGVTNVLTFARKKFAILVRDGKIPAIQN